ncbi:FixH family protein [Metabacillus fastidiosus]|uniref:FixH family protein n=1 Tax=Metabacillus fastidiosus TaxID=1458 RepID=UPI002DB772F6|nr:FixH family protein [Metabacillus fastidiosus]MEC2075960.1 FixH family protein [Metabacillus fastidiosus]
MRRKLSMFLLVSMLVLLAACNGEEGTAEVQKEVPKAVEVKLDVPETADVNSKVEMKAVVTQGDEKVADADEVEFEIWEEGKKEESNTVKAKNNGDGSYEAQTKFEHNGLFTVQVHVTARDMHTMPKKSVTVGEGIKGEEEKHEHENEANGEHAHTEGFAMHFAAPENVQVERETELSVHLQKDNKPLEKAKVRYEIWNNSKPEKHEWIDGDESAAGEYKAKHNFTEAGNYKIQIHVEDDEGLHEHEEHQIEVKK